MHARAQALMMLSVYQKAILPRLVVLEVEGYHTG